MPLDREYNKSVKYIFRGAARMAGKVAGFLAGNSEAGGQLAEEIFDRSWVDPESWQHLKFGSAPFNVVGSAKGSIAGGLEPIGPPVVTKPVFKKPIKKRRRLVHIYKPYARRRKFY